MELDRKALKARAKEAMRITRPSFWLVTLVYILMTSGVSLLLELIPSQNGGLEEFATFSLFLTLAYALYSTVIEFGYALWALWTCRRLNPDLGALIQGFSVAGRVIWMRVLILVRLFGWCLVISFGVSLGAVFVSTSRIGMIFILLPLTCLAVLCVSMRYALAPYFLADFPDLGPAVAIYRSVQLMKGWIWEFLKLHLSFFGWHLLGGVLETLGVLGALLLSGSSLSVWSGLSLDALYTQMVQFIASPWVSLGMIVCALPITLWLTPYLNIAIAEFYNARVQLAAQSQQADPFGPIMPM